MHNKNTSTPLIPKVINFIWSGSVVGPTEYMKWQAVNPGYQVNLYVDDAFIPPFRDQFNKTGIKIFRLSNVKKYMPLDVVHLVQKVTNKNNPDIVPNLAVLSDFYRFYILNEEGGWYTETDVVPVNLDSLAIDPELKCRINAKRDNNMATQILPSVLGVSKGNLLIKLVCELAREMAIAFNKPKMVENMASKDAEIRKVSTELITGYFIRAALGKYIINGKPLTEGEVITDIHVFDRFASHFEEKNAISWIFKKIELNGEIIELEPLERIIVKDKTEDEIEQIIIVKNMIKDIDKLSHQAFDKVNAQSVKMVTNKETIDKDQNESNANTTQEETIHSHAYSCQFELSAFIILCTFLVGCVNRYLPLPSILPRNKQRPLTDEEKNKIHTYERNLNRFRKELNSTKTECTDRKTNWYLNIDNYNDAIYLMKKATGLIDTMKKTNITSTSGMSDLHHHIQRIEELKSKLKKMFEKNETKKSDRYQELVESNLESLGYDMK